MKEKLTLKLLKERYAVIRLEKDESIPTWVFVGKFN
ncbi:Uncharacterized conserved protein [Sarcina ventriculi]|nr:Uncharacterized conserved protein [Sarcina ventriculi]